MNTFFKQERLSSEVAISKLFAQSDSFFAYPFRVVYLFVAKQSKTPAKFAVSVPKKKFKHAVDRNRIKRLTREAYRLNKHMLYADLVNYDFSVEFMLIYTQSTIPVFDNVRKSILKAINELKTRAYTHQQKIRND